MDDIPKDVDNTDSEESSSATSTATVFAWVAAILINGSFIALVAWGTFSNWSIGFAFAVLYSIVLLVVPYFLKRRNGGRDSVLTSLLFLLAIIAIAMTGSYLPLNVFPCSEGGFLDDDYYPTNGWVTETENLPSNIQKWYEDEYPYDTFSSNFTSFVYFNNTGVTLFSGTDGLSSGEKLWRKIDGKAPEVVTDINNPETFILVEETSTACFLFTDYLNMREKKMACTNDGVEISTTEDFFNNPYQLFYSNNLIWFLSSSPPESKNFGPRLLHSADPSNLNEVKLYSSITIEEEDKATDNECTPDRTNRVRFMSLLFLSGIPSFITALVISFLYKIPSMPVGGYLSITWLAICLIFTIDPSFDNMNDFFRWWSVFTSGPWMIILALAHLTNRMTKREIVWGINFASIVYTVGMFILLQVFSEDTFWRWALLTMFAIIPLFLFSVITDQIVLMMLASIVILVDVYKLTNYITEIVGFDESFPVQFIVLGLSGLALGFLGMLFSKRQSQFESALSAWTESILGRWLYSGEEAGNDDNDEDGNA